MLNQIVLVGRLSKKIKDVTEKNGKKEVSFILKVARPDKNSKKSNDYDYIKCILRNSIAENTAKYCEVGSIVGIKGRVETNRIEDNGNADITMYVVAERVTFLDGKKSKIKDYNSVQTY